MSQEKFDNKLDIDYVNIAYMCHNLHFYCLSLIRKYLCIGLIQILRIVKYLLIHEITKKLSTY